MAKPAPQKTECINPNTGSRMNIDTSIYKLFSKAIYHSLKKHSPLTYTQIVQGVKDCFGEQKARFEGSVEWYVVAVKHDMVAKGIIEIFTEKGRKLHRLPK